MKFSITENAAAVLPCGQQVKAWPRMAGITWSEYLNFGKSREALIYFVWRRCLTFFETAEDGRVHSCFKKKSRLAKRNNCAFPRGSLISGFLKALTRYEDTAQRRGDMLCGIAFIVKPAKKSTQTEPLRAAAPAVFFGVRQGLFIPLG
ncbi:hypothetical protein [Desulfovibrio sp.]|uniref:hypothetical protein n=1 Tax=Desulfovibrio sp. TaxID=885 RepID=UPI0039E25810